jgi:hypothetical protein
MDIRTYNVTEPINKTMYHNAPPDKLVVPIAVPNNVGSWDSVLTTLDFFVASEGLTKGINMSVGTMDSFLLYPEAMVLQEANNISKAWLRATVLDKSKQKIKVVVCDISESLINPRLFHFLSQCVSMDTK